MSVRPANTQISLGIRTVWSESSLCAWRKLGSLATHQAHSEDSDQTGRMPRLIWVFAGRTTTLLVLSCRGLSALRYNAYMYLVWRAILNMSQGISPRMALRTWCKELLHKVTDSDRKTPSMFHEKTCNGALYFRLSFENRKKVALFHSWFCSRK